VQAFLLLLLLLPQDPSWDEMITLGWLLLSHFCSLPLPSFSPHLSSPPLSPLSLSLSLSSFLGSPSDNGVINLSSTTRSKQPDHTSLSCSINQTGLLQERVTAFIFLWMELSCPSLS